MGELQPEVITLRKPTDLNKYYSSPSNQDGLLTVPKKIKEHFCWYNH